MFAIIKLVYDPLCNKLNNKHQFLHWQLVLEGQTLPQC